ncbi:MAG TPA: DUF1508 domain-containing protein, partial [Pricia sp.]|nr:DUF1508 domain-containing protein [Pricia sp.]
MIKITQIDNGHQFEVQTQNGDTLLTSIAYMDKDKMDETIQNLLAVNANKNHFERRTNTEGKFIFSLKDDSGSTIGHSELYDSEAVSYTHL